MDFHGRNAFSINFLRRITMREVTIFSIDKKFQCVAGDYMEFNTYNTDFIHCNNHSDPLVNIDGTFEKRTAPIERVRYRTPFNEYEEYICIDPKEREKIKAIIEKLCFENKK